MKTTLLTLLAITASTLAKTDLEGCTSSQTIAYGGASMIYWDPTNGEICSFLDCGGGRAPPKTTVPGCDNYVGTKTYEPDYMPGWSAATATSSEAEDEAEETSSSAAESVPAYETKTGSASSTLVTSKAVLSSTTGISAGLASYVAGLSTASANATASGNATASVGSPTSTSAVEATGAAVAVGVKGGLIGLVAGVVGLVVL